MTYSDAYPWQPGEAGILQRLPHAVREWMRLKQVTSHRAALRFVASDDRWPTGLSVPGPSLFGSYIGGKSDEEPRAKHLPSAPVLWAMCECMDVSLEWVLFARGARARGGLRSSQQPSDFETELANRVLAEMPLEGTAEGSLSQSIKLSGAACITYAIDAVKTEWMRVHERTDVFETVKLADHAAYHHFKHLYGSDDAPGMINYRTLKKRLDAIAMAAERPPILALRPYPENEDYTEFFALPAISVRVDDDSHVYEIPEEYGHVARCPPGFATRAPEGAWSAASQETRRTVKKEYLARQQDEEKKRLADLRAQQDATKPAPISRRR